MTAALAMTIGILQINSCMYDDTNPTHTAIYTDGSCGDPYCKLQWGNHVALSTTRDGPTIPHKAYEGESQLKSAAILPHDLLHARERIIPNWIMGCRDPVIRNQGLSFLPIVTRMRSLHRR